MDYMNDLRDLLRYDVTYLRSVENQIIDAMPQLINKASNPDLKMALEQHLRITELQRNRIDQIIQQLGEATDNGIFSNLFSSGVKSRGMEGLIDDGQKIVAADMDPDVMDATIIGCVQKIEHVEIAAYGTARAYAEQLGLTTVAQLLEQTLMEEHDADERLTSLAVRRINREAEAGTGMRR